MVFKEKEIPKALSREFQIGGGDLIRITSFSEIELNKRQGFQISSKDLQGEALSEAQEKISKLPFRFGSMEHVGTFPRRVYNADITVSRRAVPYNAAENDSDKYRLSFKFNEDAGMPGVVLSLSTCNELSIEHGTAGESPKATTVRFAPEENLRIAGREIGEVTLVIPIKLP